MTAADLPTSPIIAQYSLSAPASWTRLVLKPVQAVLRRLFPKQATAQKELGTRDRVYEFRADVRDGWALQLTFDGDLLTVAFVPPQTERIL